MLVDLPIYLPLTYLPTYSYQPAPDLPTYLPLTYLLTSDNQLVAGLCFCI